MNWQAIVNGLYAALMVGGLAFSLIAIREKRFEQAWMISALTVAVGLLVGFLR